VEAIAFLGDMIRLATFCRDVSKKIHAKNKGRYQFRSGVKTAEFESNKQISDSQ